MTLLERCLFLNYLFTLCIGKEYGEEFCEHELSLMMQIQLDSDYWICDNAINGIPFSNVCVFSDNIDNQE